MGALLSRALRRTLRSLGQVPKSIIDVSSKLLYYTTIAIAAIIGLGLAGVNVAGLSLAGGVLGVALGFAAQTVTSNFLSGLFLYIDKPLEPGDLVEVPGLGVTGRVADVTMFSTRIETLDGLNVRIPNEDIFKSTIVNYSKTVAVRVGYDVGISYDSDIELARETITRLLDEDPMVLAEPEPVVYVEELGDSAVVLKVLFWTPSWAWIETRRRLLGEIKKALDEAGIEIPFPQRVVHLRLEAPGEEHGVAQPGPLEEALRGAPRGPGRAAEELGLEQS